MILGAFKGIFELLISTHFDTVSPLSMFSKIINHYFYKKNKPFYSNPKYLFGIADLDLNSPLDVRSLCGKLSVAITSRKKTFLAIIAKKFPRYLDL